MSAGLIPLSVDGSKEAHLHGAFTERLCNGSLTHPGHLLFLS
jgi:hypothetical protein